MSTIDHPPQRNWWSLPQRSPSGQQVFVEKPQSTPKHSQGKFNTLATVMGFKPKKSHPPPLTIPDHGSPPAVHLAPRSEPHQRRPYTAPSNGVTRPPSTSVSSSRSRVDSLEPNSPQTPEDSAQARRGSLLTLSDTDPFAARVISVRSASDPNRLSAFSHSSAHESKSHEPFSRVSYASSSSQSFRLGSELSPLSIVSPVLEPGSSADINRKTGLSPRKKDSSSDTWLFNLGDTTNRLSQPDPAPKQRPAMRARGMTDSGAIERTNFLRSESFSRPAPSPKSLSSVARSPSSPNPPSPRKSSLSRPTAPPTSDLPSPPPRSSDFDRALGSLSAGSTSSSSLTFSPEFKPVSPRSRNKHSYEPLPSPPKTVESSWEPDAPRPRTLKKSMSQQSINKRAQQSSPSSSAVHLPEPTNHAAPRKQRSFHRVPVPAVPLQLPLSEQRATEPLNLGRKRLFSSSSSRRPSQSTISLMDDARSTRSAAGVSEPDRERNASMSYWIDADQPPRSPTSTTHEYTPQQIMSPAEMLQVEASVDAEYHSRPRGTSIVSASALSDFEHDIGFGLSPTTSGNRKRSNSEHPSRPTSSRDIYFTAALPPEPPSPPVLMSLPPPPRRTKSRASSMSSRGQPDTVAPLSPPPRKILRPKVSAEERMHRQSLLRKPSFLDIDDEVDKDPQPVAIRMRQDSFLDLTRDSFDSMRSDDDSLF